jgi:hypothetical protein
MYLPDGRRDDEFLRVFRRKGRFDHIFASLLHQRGADPDRKDRKGWAPVLFSARKDSIEGLSWLKSVGANLDARDDLGTSALHVAAIQSNVKSVKWLLEHAGLGPDPKNSIGATPLHWAIDQKTFNREIMDALEAGGADLHAITIAGWRAIDFANNRQQSGWNGDFSLSIAWLKERGAADDAPLRAKLLKPKWFKKGDEKTRMLKTCKDGNERLRVKTSANQSEESTNAEKMKRARLKSQRLHDENKHSL